MDCSFPDCNQEEIYEGTCNNSRIQYCRIHMGDHMLNCKKNHENPTRKKKINSLSKEYVLNKLKYLYKKINIAQIDLDKNYTDMMKSLENRYMMVYHEMGRTKQRLISFINKLSKQQRGLPICRAIQVIVMDQDKALKEVKTWDNIFEFKLNKEILNEGIKKYATIIQNFDFLFTEKNMINEKENMFQKINNNYHFKAERGYTPLENVRIESRNDLRIKFNGKVSPSQYYQKN